MKRTIPAVVPMVLLVASWAAAQDTLTNEVQSNPVQNQTTQAVGGGLATSDSDSTSVALSEGGTATSSSNSSGGTGVGWSDSVSSLSLTTITNVKNRVAPLGTYPAYLPNFQHGGWGTVQAYFANGPTSSDKVYERMFEPQCEEDMAELKGVLCSLPYDTPLDWVGALFNGVAVVFGGPDNFHHGRGFEISNSVVRHRRTEDKPLVIMIDSYVDPQALAEAGYTYIGRISIEGKVERNWDQVYNAAIAEAMPWDVDLLLISGGMKGVTVGSTLSFPSASMGYSQTNYSLSLGGGYVSGITEGKGKAVLSASAFRFSPDVMKRRRVPAALSERVRVRPSVAAAPARAGTTTAAATTTAAPAAKTTVSASAQRPIVPQEATAPKNTGIEMSRELYQMAGFSGNQPVNNVAVR
jgi:hypothetical protein